MIPAKLKITVDRSFEELVINFPSGSIHQPSPKQVGLKALLTMEEWKTRLSSLKCASDLRVSGLYDVP